MIQLIVGLGNPGVQYKKTRHNAGAWMIHFIAKELNLQLSTDTKLRSQLTKTMHWSSPCWIACPMTFMNECGVAVAAIARFYKITPESILVMHDELDFEPGIVRLKRDGGHGGHNGLRDIIAHLGSSDFYRLRIGIGHPGYKNQVTSYVLNEPSHAEHVNIMIAIDEAYRVIPDLIAGEFDRAFHQLHSDSD